MKARKTDGIMKHSSLCKSEKKKFQSIPGTRKSNMNTKQTNKHEKSNNKTIKFSRGLLPRLPSNYYRSVSRVRRAEWHRNKPEDKDENAWKRRYKNAFILILKS